jgi:hypothetical protein
MKDAGRNLREYLKDNYQIDLLCRALDIYTPMQLLSIPHVDALLDNGIQDWRLGKLPNLYLQFMSQENLLKADGLIAAEINTLHKLYPRVVKLCHQLSEYGIPETIEHGDFHDNNILVHEGHLIISDWGDAGISHPFFSLASCFDSAIRNHELIEGDERYLRLKMYILKNGLPTAREANYEKRLYLLKN